jgi:phosphate transport system substrate-binding protein
MKRTYSLVIAFLLVSLIAGAQDKIRIGGSDTLILLGQRFEQQYSIHHAARFNIVGGGVAEAKEALGNGRLDIVQSEGTPYGPMSFPVGVQGIVIYVNKANPVAALTIAQVRSIFLGEITNWKQLGGPDKQIVLYAGESSTGMESYFDESVLRGQEPYPFTGKANTHALLDAIANDPAGIGYGSLGVDAGVHTIGIKLGAASIPVDPDSTSIRNRSYPISRYVYWTVGQKPGGALQTFCAWVFSSEGQLVVEGVGFQPLLPDQRKQGLAKVGVKPAVAGGHSNGK